jgi:hypothetical protein
MTHPFVVGQWYSNRHGTYEVLRLMDTTMDVRFEDGREATLSIAAQKLALLMEQLPPDRPPTSVAAPAKARAKRPATNVFNPDECLPVVAQVIRERYRITRTWVTSEEIVDGLLVHPAAKRMIERLLDERKAGSPDSVAGEFVGWFATRMNADGPALVYETQFERSPAEPFCFKLRPPT